MTDGYFTFTGPSPSFYQVIQGAEKLQTLAPSLFGNGNPEAIRAAYTLVAEVWAAMENAAQQEKENPAIKDEWKKYRDMISEADAAMIRMMKKEWSHPVYGEILAVPAFS